jgi:YbgC/YbaW family acyl-CoA thioester hydrolase
VFPSERFPKAVRVEKPFNIQRKVELVDLDVYEHVNNATYVNYAEEALAQDFSAKGWPPARLVEASLAVVVRRVHVQYASIASWGETLNITAHPLTINDSGGSQYISMTRADGSSVAECVLDWELVDRKNGGAQSLPDELR